MMNVLFAAVLCLQCALALAPDSLAITKGVLGPSTKHCAYPIPMLPVGSPYRSLALRRSEQAKTFWILVVGPHPCQGRQVWSTSHLNSPRTVLIQCIAEPRFG